MAVIRVSCSLKDLPPASVVENFWNSARERHVADLVDDVAAQIPGGTVSGENLEFTRAVADTTGKRIDAIVARSTGCDFTR